MRFLPAAYRRGDARPSFGEPAMLLLESLLDELEGAIDGLPLLFDPRTAPDDGAPDSWLDWLAGWLGVELQEEWDDAKRRSTVAAAFAANGRRGTVEGLIDAIRLATGAVVHISEPGTASSIWSLGETSTLGASTMLAVAHPDGAIVGVTATPGQSHLIREDEYGAPLFEDQAHTFCVSAYAVDLAGVDATSTMRAVIDREKPAHTAYELCTIDALLRVGFQAQVGIDTIVGNVPCAFVNGGEQLLGFGTVLPPPPAHAAVGQTTGLGRVIRLA
jgi:phage tail-like protein